MSLETDANPIASYEITKQQLTLAIKKDEVIQEFVERKHLHQTEVEYPRNGTNPGLVLIFNQEKFHDRSSRLGSRKDVNEIILSMTRLGYNITDKHIFTDLTQEAIFQNIDSILQEDLSQVNCLILFFLTHGDNFNTLHSYDLPLRADELWSRFSDCKALQNKPKLFIFQACKGGLASTIPDGQSKTEIDLVPDSTFQSNFISSDMLIAYSTTEGNFAFRDPKHGTWFIQELCKNFLSYGRQNDVVSLLMRTSKCLARNYYNYDDKTDKIQKQMPVFISTLRKKFYLNRTKEKNSWLGLLQNQQVMKQQLRDLESRIDNLASEKDKRGHK